MTYYFCGLNWNSENNSVIMIYGSPNSPNFLRKKLNIGDELNISILNRRFCIGTETTQSQRISCYQRRINDKEKEIKSNYFLLTPNTPIKNQSDIDSFILPDNKNYKQCFRCTMLDYFKCRMICVGDYCNPTTKKAESKCTPAKTHVYITSVADRLKVGVSLRIPGRWLEQGSDLATKIAIAPGLEARQLEQYISKFHNLKLQVTNKEKISNLQVSQNSEKINTFNSLTNKIYDDLNEKYKYHNSIKIIEPQTINLSSIYGSLPLNQPIQNIEINPTNSFGGKIIAIKGSILVTQLGKYYYSINLRSMINREFEFLQNPPQIETQSFLDQWF